MCNDLKWAKQYVAKAMSSEARGIPFTLSFTSYKNLRRAKKCHFTGLPLTESTWTIDRVDSSLPYEKGNVVACHTTFNSFKSMIENPSNHLTLDKAVHALQKVQKYLNKGEKQ